MNGWNDDCEMELLDTLANPLASGVDLLNPNRGDLPFSVVEVQLIIEQFYQGTWYPQQQYYASKFPMRGRDRAGMEISTLSYTLIDTYDPSRLTFKGGGAKGQRVRVRNANGTQVFFKGAIETIRPTAVHQRDDGTDKRYLTFNCIDEFWLFKRTPIKEIIENTTDCGMVADLCSRYVPELDISGINVALGKEIVKRTIDGLYLDEIIKGVLQANPDLAFFLDITQEPSRIVLDARDAVEVVVPIELTDTNIYNYCRPGDFDIDTTGKGYRNQIIHTAPSLYSQGTVDVEKNTYIVYGTGTDWYGKVNVGDTFQIPGSESRYTVAKNLAGPGGTTQELYLNGDYQEDTATGLSYQVIGKERTISVEDLNEIERMKEITGEYWEGGGIRAVEIRESTPLTDEEQEQVAENALRLDAYDGYFNTHNIMFPVKNLRAGQTLNINMPLRGVQDKVPIQEIDWTVGGGIKEPVANLEDPPIKYRISLTDRVLFSENAFRDLLIAQRRGKFRDFEKLEITKSLGERYAAKVCTRGTEGEEVNEQYSASVDVDEYSTAAYSAGPFYPETIEPGQLALQVFDPDNPLETFTYPT